MLDISLNGLESPFHPFFFHGLGVMPVRALFLPNYDGLVNDFVLNVLYSLAPGQTKFSCPKFTLTSHASPL